MENRTEFEKELDLAYKKYNHNAYFSTGFIAGVDFMINKLSLFEISKPNYILPNGDIKESIEINGKFYAPKPNQQ